MHKKLAMLIILVMFLPFVVGASEAFAYDDELKIAIPSNDRKALTEVMEEINGSDGSSSKMDIVFKATVDETELNNTLIEYDESAGIVIFNSETFNKATEKSRRIVLSDFVKELQKSKVTNQTQQIIMDNMAEGNRQISTLLLTFVIDDSSADVYTAMKWVAPILPIVRLLFGIGAIFITILLIASTVLDLVFIGLPVARDSILENNYHYGGASKSGAKSFITSDAVSAIKESEAALDPSGGYKNAYVIYFKRRVLTYIILSICLLYLVVGELGGLIAWLLSLGEGVVQ